MQFQKPVVVLKQFKCDVGVLPLCENFDGPLLDCSHPSRTVSDTVGYQLDLAVQKKEQNVPAEYVSEARQFFINQSAHEFPPALAAFDGLGWHPFHLYHRLTYDKLNVIDLGLLRCFAELTPSIVLKKTNLPMT